MERKGREREREREREKKKRTAICSAALELNKFSVSSFLLRA